MTIITGNDCSVGSASAPAAIGGWKPPYRVSPRSSMRAVCHMLPTRRSVSFSSRFLTNSLPRWKNTILFAERSCKMDRRWGRDRSKYGRRFRVSNTWISRRLLSWRKVYRDWIAIFVAFRGVNLRNGIGVMDCDAGSRKWRMEDADDATVAWWKRLSAIWVRHRILRVRMM